MEDIKSTRIQALEQSLINFLMMKRDLADKMGTGYRRVRTLQIQLNDKNPKHLTFTIQMGMFSAEFNMMNGLKEKGSCFGLERYIRDWAERDSIRSEMLELTSINKGGSGNVLRTNVRNLVR